MTMTLGTDEFMRRFLLHVLPSGFHRIRHDGLLANGERKCYLTKARALLHAEPDARTQLQSTEATTASAAPIFVCPDCGAPMTIIETFARGQCICAPPRNRAIP